LHPLHQAMAASAARGRGSRPAPRSVVDRRIPTPSTPAGPGNSSDQTSRAAAGRLAGIIYTWSSFVYFHGDARANARSRPRSTPPRLPGRSERLYSLPCAEPPVCRPGAWVCSVVLARWPMGALGVLIVAEAPNYGDTLASAIRAEKLASCTTLRPSSRRRALSRSPGAPRRPRRSP
jgi:hypothetical protein